MLKEKFQKGKKVKMGTTDQESCHREGWKNIKRN
jgi:hypothetical protein